VRAARMALERGLFSRRALASELQRTPVPASLARRLRRFARASR